LNGDSEDARAYAPAQDAAAATVKDSLQARLAGRAAHTPAQDSLACRLARRTRAVRRAVNVSGRRTAAVLRAKRVLQCVSESCESRVQRVLQLRRSRSAASSGGMSRCALASISYPTMNFRTDADRSSGG
jgi:hypothetical protein